MKRTILLSSLLISFFVFSFNIENTKDASYDHYAAIKLELSKHPASPYRIVIDKSDYELKVFNGEEWYETYPIVFGSKDLSDKMWEGDRKTPNGSFTIIQKMHNPKWGAQLLLDYPTNENVSKFNQRKRDGVIPKYAKIGGGIAIHGTRPDEEWTVDYYQNWTDGCISLKHSEMKDLFAYIPIGTVVTIVP